MGAAGQDQIAGQAVGGEGRSGTAQICSTCNFRAEGPYDVQPLALTLMKLTTSLIAHNLNCYKYTIAKFR